MESKYHPIVTATATAAEAKPLTPAEERARALTSTLHEICGLIREHNSGKALDVAERAIGAPDQFTAACATIKDVLIKDPIVLNRVMRDLVYLLDSAAEGERREETACRIITALFGTKIVCV
jgi:hypothetical protein